MRIVKQSWVKQSWVKQTWTINSLVCLTLVLGAILGGCGTRGALEYPAESKASDTASADSGQGKPENAAPKPHKPFVLDGLIR